MTVPSDASQHQDLDARYVAARRVLLDALTALAPHGDAVILAGAQAVYLHTGTADLAIAPYTTDGDLVLDPLLLGDAPELEAGMSAAGFHLQLQPGGHVEPGIWLASASADGREFLVPVDLIVPEGAASGTGKRAARLAGHGARAARRAVGLEASRRPARGQGRLRCRATHADDEARRGRGHAQRSCPGCDCRAPTTAALTYIEELFGRRGRPGIEMASRALRTAIPEDRVQAICVAYVTALVP
jgi:hypothetical protein